MLTIRLYPSAALINHSCNPNCVAVFHGNKVVVRAIKDIPENTEVVNQRMYLFMFRLL